MATTVRTTKRLTLLHLPEHPAEEEMMLETLSEDRIDTISNPGDQRCLGGVRLCGAQRVPDLDHAPVDVPHPVDEQAQQPSDGRIDDETRGDRAQPGCSLVGRHD